MPENKNEFLDLLITKGEKIEVKIGERVARPDEFTPMIYRVHSGELRLLFKSREKRGTQTLKKIGKGSWIGLSNFIYGEPCEWVTASSDVILEAVPTDLLSKDIWTNPSIISQIMTLEHCHIVALSLSRWLDNVAKPPANPDSFIKSILDVGQLLSIDDVLLDHKYQNNHTLIGASYASGLIGRQITYNQLSNLRKNEYKSPILFLAIPNQFLEKNYSLTNKSPYTKLKSFGEQVINANSPDAYSLGIRDDNNKTLREEFPERRGIGDLGSQLAVYEMVAKSFNLPFRRDSMKKRIGSYEATGQKVSTQLMAKYCTYMGLEARPVSVKAKDIKKITPPFLIERDNKPILIHAFRGNYFISGDGVQGLQRKTVQELVADSEMIDFVSIKKTITSARDIFNWNWVWNIVRKYRGSLLLVVVISLVAQLFALGVPLLLQQLIDKS